MKEGVGHFKVWDYVNRTWYTGNMDDILEFNWFARGLQIGEGYVEIKTGNYEVIFQENGEFRKPE